MVKSLWLDGGRIFAAGEVIHGAVGISGQRITALRTRAPKGVKTIDVRGCYVAPGFIDLHVWGEPDVLSRELPQQGTTAFLTTLGPEPPGRLAREIKRRASLLPTGPSTGAGLCGAACLGFHLEGPFLNPARGGALPKRWMRAPSTRECARLWHAAAGRIKMMMTLAPELRGAEAAIRWCRRHRVTVSLGHSDADERAAHRGVQAGATAVTHVFNGMPPLHHRRPSLIDVALNDSRLTTMAILDGVHLSPSAFRLLVKAKGVDRIALVTDSIRRAGWEVVRRGRAFYRRGGTLAGSALSMTRAVRNAVELGGVSLPEAVRMATEVPARLIGDRARGTLKIGAPADLVVFDRNFGVRMTLVGGRVVYQRGQ